MLLWCFLASLLSWLQRFSQHKPNPPLENTAVTFTCEGHQRCRGGRRLGICATLTATVDSAEDTNRWFPMIPRGSGPQLWLTSRQKHWQASLTRTVCGASALPRQRANVASVTLSNLHDNRQQCTRELMAVWFARIADNFKRNWANQKQSLQPWWFLLLL